jgi:hypothetical protein
MPFFADTNVCSKWETDPVVKQNWQVAKAQLESEGHKYVACPLVLIELLSQLVKPESKYFSEDLKSFLFLGNAQERFLSFPGAFVLKTILGVQSPVTTLHPSDFNQILRCVVSASSREALESGDVELTGSTLFSYGLDFAKIGIPHENGKRAYAAIMKKNRLNERLPTGREHAEGILSNLQIIPANGDVEAVESALDAAYQYECFLLSEVDASYDYLEHASDWVDRQLLYYLADPAMFIVTNDKNVKYRCRRSKQSHRVLVI